MKSFTQFLMVSLVCALTCHAQESTSPDQQVLAAANKAFLSQGWNPEIFEAHPIRKRNATVEELLSGPNYEAIKQDVLKNFGNGPLTVVGYKRRPSTLKDNGGTGQCNLLLMVFSTGKVAIIDGRAHECPADKLPKKKE